MRPRAAPTYDEVIKSLTITVARSSDFHVRSAHAAKPRAALPRCATLHKLGTRKCKAPAGRQISLLSERAALFARCSGNAAALARIYLSVRSAWDKVVLEPRCPNPNPMAVRY